jgi:membrane protease YdiL (CAAX protease family)
MLVVWTLRRIASPTKLKLNRSPGRPNSLTPLHILLLLAVWIGVSVGISAILKAASAERAGGATLLTTVTQQALWLACSLVVADMTFRGGLGHGLGLSLRHWRWDLLRGAAGYLMIFPLCLGALYLTISLLPERLAPKHDLLIAIKSTWPGWESLVGIFSAVVMASAAEEVFFRGLFQSMMRSYTKSPWLAILSSAAFFAIVHVRYLHTLPALFILGVGLGYNYARSGRLLAPILIHAIFNAVNIISHMTS